MINEEFLLWLIPVTVAEKFISDVGVFEYIQIDLMWKNIDEDTEKVKNIINTILEKYKPLLPSKKHEYLFMHNKKEITVRIKSSIPAISVEFEGKNKL